MAKLTFVVTARNAAFEWIRTHSYGEAERKAKDLSRRIRGWTDIHLATGEILAEVSPDGVVNLTFKGCEFA